MSVRVVTDSTCDLPEAVRQQSGIVTVPLRLHFADEVFRDRVDLDDSEFVRRLVQGKLPPSTSQPPPGDFEAVYRQLLADGADEIVSVHIASALSGTVSSANIAAQAVDSQRIHVVDSRTVSLGTGFLVLEAVARAEAGDTAAEIVARLATMPTRVGIICLLDTLRFLLLGGRIGKVRAMLGTALAIKPLIGLGPDGSVVPLGRVRSRASGVRRLAELLAEHRPLERCGVIYVGAPDDGLALAEQTRRTYPDMEVIADHCSPVLSTHTGPNTLAYCYLEAEA
ncbi:MAG: DegV family protein [Candidatus Dormibacteria bacterium]